MKRKAKISKSQEKKGGNSSTEDALLKLLSGGKVLDISKLTLNSDASSHISFQETRAFTWPIAVVARYVAVAMELPQYATLFQNAEINGMALISIDSLPHISSMTINLQHNLHGLKILSHAKHLRDRVLEHAAAFVTPIAKSTAPLSSLKDWSCIRVASWLRYGYCFGIQDERPAIMKPNSSESESSKDIDLDTLEREVELRGGRCRCSDCETKRSSSEKGVVLILRSRMSGEKIVLLLMSIAAEAQEAAASSASNNATVFAETAVQKLSTALLQDGKALCGRMNMADDIAEATENDDDIDRQSVIDTASAVLSLGSKLSLLPLPVVTPPEDAKEETKRDEDEAERERRQKRDATLQPKKKVQADAAVVRRLVDHHQAQQQQQQRRQKLERLDKEGEGEEDGEEDEEGDSGGEGEGEEDRETEVPAVDSMSGQRNQQPAAPKPSPKQQPEPQIQEGQKAQNLKGVSRKSSLRQQQPQHQENEIKPKPITKPQLSSSIQPPPPRVPQPLLNSQNHARKIMHRVQHSSGDEETDLSSPENSSEKVGRDPISQPTFETASKSISSGDNQLLLQEIRALSEEIRSVKEQQAKRSDQLLPSPTDVQRLVAERDQAILELKKMSQLIKEQREQQYKGSVQIHHDTQMLHGRREEVGNLLGRESYEKTFTTDPPPAHYDTRNSNSHTVTDLSEPLFSSQDALSHSQLMLGTHYNNNNNYSDKNRNTGQLSPQPSESSSSTKADWQAVVTKYRIAEPTSIASFEDTIDLLRIVAMKWVRLGLHMMDICSMNKDESDHQLVVPIERTLLAELIKWAHKSLTTLTVTIGSGQVRALHRHNLAIYVVFGLGLVLKLLKMDDSMNEHLLRKLSYGDLPLSELSRENFRGLLHSNLGIDLRNKWDLFDSLWQRLGGGRGFVSVQNIVDSFIRLTPNFSIFLPLGGDGEEKGTDKRKRVLSSQEEQRALVDAQHSTLLLLSTCVHSLATLSSSLSPSRSESESILSSQTTTPPHLALLKLLHSRAATVASFHSALRSLTDSATHNNNNNSSSNSWKPTTNLETTAAVIMADSRLADDTANSAKQQLGYRQLVADVLFELSKPFVQRLLKAIEVFSSSNSLTRSIDQAIKCYTSEKGLSPEKEKELRSDMKLLLNHLKPTATRPVIDLEKLKLFCHNHQDICSSTARSLAIYNVDMNFRADIKEKYQGEASGQGGTGALLLSLSALFLSVSSFRLTVLTQADRLVNPTLLITLTNQQLASQLTTVTEMMHTFLHLSTHQQVGQPNLGHTGNSKTVHQHPVFRRAKSPQLNLAALESVLAELFGLPCPAPGRIGSPHEKPLNLNDREGADSAVPLVDNGLCVSQLLAVEPVMLLCSYDAVSQPQLQKQALFASHAVDDVLSLLLSGAVPPASAPPSSMLLVQMRDIIERDLWKEDQDTDGNNEFRGGTTPVRNTRDNHRTTSPITDSRKTHSANLEQRRNQLDTTSSSTIDAGYHVTNDSSSGDIMEALKHYLGVLNSSMAERNKVLRRLVTLWQRTKRIFEDNEEELDKKIWERRTTTLPKPPIASLFPEIMRPDDDHNQRNRISSAQVFREVEAIQRSLLETDTQQQQQKIRFSTVTQAMTFKSYDNLTAVPVLREISLLEQGMRQGSADATKLISKLLNRLGSFH